MGVFADRQAARDQVDYDAITAARDQEVADYAMSQSNSQRDTEEAARVATINIQNEAAVAGATSEVYTGGVPGDQNFDRADWFPTVLEEVEVMPEVPIIQYEQSSYSVSPEAAGPDVPMRLPHKPPPVGALMVFLGRQLLMTMPFKVGDGPLEMKRLFQIPKHSKAYVRIHTGRGTLLPGESIHLREFTPQSSGYGTGEPEWSEIPRNLNDALGTLMKEKFFWWFYGDPLGLYGEDE